MTGVSVCLWVGLKEGEGGRNAYVPCNTSMINCLCSFACW